MLILNLYNVDFYLFEGQWMCVCYTGAGYGVLCTAARGLLVAFSNLKL